MSNIQQWDSLSLKNLSIVPISNGIFNDPKKVGTGYKLVNVVNLYDEPYINTEKLKLLDVSSSELKKFQLEKGDLLFTRSSLKWEGIAHCNMFISNDIDAVFECHTMRIRPNEEIVFSHYLYYFCRSDMARRYFMKQAQTTTMTTIRQKGIGSLLVHIPPLSEQKAIVDTLQTWDIAIEKTEALIAAKQRQFDWLQSKLLKNAKQNPDTKTVSLGQLLEYEQPTKYIVKSKDYLDSAHTPVLTANKSFILGYTNENEGIFDKHPVIIFDDFTTDIKYVNFPFKVKSSAMKILLPKNNQVEIYYVFAAMSKVKVPLGGHKRYWISEYQFLNIPLPSIKLQQEIAAALNTAKKEIDLLRSLAEQYRTQKRGLMQKLLTGKWRVRI